MSIDQLQQQLNDGLVVLRLNHSHVIQQLLLRYIQLLIEWNKVYNLTAIKKPEEILIKHILDSLSISIYLKGDSILDVGTGAGLPGIPLAIVNPDKRFVLLDSNSKKTRFLYHVKQQLSLDNIEIVTNRVEAFTTNDGFDNIVTRAYATLKEFTGSTQHLLKEQGQFLAMKGLYPESELSEIIKKFSVVTVQELIVPFLNAERHLVCIVKRNNQLEAK